VVITQNNGFLVFYESKVPQQEFAANDIATALEKGTVGDHN